MIKKKPPSSSFSFSNVRESLLLSAYGDENGVSVSGGNVREATRIVGQQVALNLDAHWQLGLSQEGPVDVIDMFSGCGGMSAGFVAANGAFPSYRMAMAIDISEQANQTYSRNIGICPIKEDVGALADDPELLNELLSRSRRRPGHPLVLIGCAPCQGFSSHRNAAGEADSRNNLFAQFAKIASHLNPDAVVIENVPELLTDRYWHFLEEAKAILVNSGYHLHVGVHNLAEFGVPQERFRALILAMKRPFVPPVPLLDRKDFRTVHDAIGDLPPVSAGKVHPSDPMHYTAGHRASTMQTIRAVPKNGGNRPSGVGPDCLRRVEERQGRAAYEDVYGRLWWMRPSITITAYARNPASGRYLHPEQDRALSVREAALLQGFPKHFWFYGSLDERFRQIGNAVPPTFAAYISIHVLGELLAPAAVEPTRTGISSPVGPSFARLIPALKARHRSLESLEAAK
jgi:DNA (cytosine-5)-methyltransferase 1